MRIFPDYISLASSLRAAKLCGGTSGIKLANSVTVECR